MSKYCNYILDSLVECLSKDSDLFEESFSQQEIAGEIEKRENVF